MKFALSRICTQRRIPEQCRFHALNLQCLSYLRFLKIPYSRKFEVLNIKKCSPRDRPHYPSRPREECSEKKTLWCTIRTLQANEIKPSIWVSNIDNLIFYVQQNTILELQLSYFGKYFRWSTGQSDPTVRPPLTNVRSYNRMLMLFFKNASWPDTLFGHWP
jgi:hypothetical protein